MEIGLDSEIGLEEGISEEREGRRSARFLRPDLETFIYELSKCWRETELECMIRSVLDS